MRHYVILRFLGLVLVINGLVLFLSSGVSLLYGDDAFRALFFSALITVLFGVFPLVFVPTITRITKEEGLIIVVGGWLLSCLFGALPYILWGGEFNFTNAWFESVSGFTTTGSTILLNIEALPNGLLFWRSATHWLGGIGIVLFVLSVLPAMGVASMVLYRTEMSGLAQDSFRHSARRALRILAAIYVGMTVAETVALLLGGMNLFDAVTHSFATIATGGFSPKNASVAFYNSVTIELIIIVFMVLSGMHFGLLFSTLIERKATLWKSSAFRYYVSAIVLATAVVTVLTHGDSFGSWWQALRHSAFQVISVGTSTGFATADSAIWNPIAQLILMLLALQCACVGSTSGGIKVDRVVMLGKAIKRQLRLLRRPHAVLPIRIDGHGVADEVVSAGILYIGLYLVVVLIAGVVMTTLGVDMLSSFSGVVATMGNVGPGLGSVGSVGNFAHIPTPGKWVLSATMLFGRLEIYGLLMFFIPAIWESRKVTP